MRMFMLMSTLSFLKFFSNIVYIDVFWSFQLLIDTHELFMKLLTMLPKSLLLLVFILK